MATIFRPSSQLCPKWRPFFVHRVSFAQNGGHLPSRQAGFPSVERDLSKMAGTCLAVRQVFRQFSQRQAKWRVFRANPVSNSKTGEDLTSPRPSPHAYHLVGPERGLRTCLLALDRQGLKRSPRAGLRCCLRYCLSLLEKG
jgi:hypothetical protein